MVKKRNDTNPSQIDWAKIDAMVDEDIDYTDISDMGWTKEL